MHKINVKEGQKNDGFLSLCLPRWKFRKSGKSGTILLPFMADDIRITLKLVRMVDVWKIVMYLLIVGNFFHGNL